MLFILGFLFWPGRPVSSQILQILITPLFCVHVHQVIQGFFLAAIETPELFEKIGFTHTGNAGCFKITPAVHPVAFDTIKGQVSTS